MASFFQPALVTLGVANNTRFLIYDNSILSRQNLTAHWYQWVILTSALVAFATAFLIVALQSWRSWRTSFLDRSRWRFDSKTVWRNWRSYTPRISPTPREKTAVSENSFSHGGHGNEDAGTFRATAECPELLGAKTFGFRSETWDYTIAYDLTIVQYSSLQRGRQDSAIAHQSPTEESMRRDDRLWLSFNVRQPCSGSSDDRDERPIVTAEIILREAKEYKRVMLFLGDSAESQDVYSLLDSLHELAVMVIIASDHDNTLLHQINLERVCGVIFTNACILTNGLHRDFFRQAELRQLLGRCERQKKARPDFFTAFLETWFSSRPSAAVIRRAHRIGEFFGALVQTGHITSDGRIITEAARECLSAFDWLKKPEVVELQRNWIMQEKRLSNNGGAGRLNMEQLQTILPEASELLTPSTGAVQTTTWAEARHDTIAALQIVLSEHSKCNYFEDSSCGRLLSSRGCFALRDEVEDHHYRIIIARQNHLRTLQLLHQCSETEISVTCESLSQVAGVSQFSERIQELVHGLQSGKVVVYKSLDTSFQLPDQGGHFWAVSDDASGAEESYSIIIYLSQGLQNDVATLLHCYLAHYGISRLDRFQEELILEQVQQPAAKLPLSLIHELKTSTTTELISMLHRLRLSHATTSLAIALRDEAEKLLVEEATRSRWTATHSRACLDGSSMEVLFQKRSDYHINAGVQGLPSVPNLCALHDVLQQKMIVALYEVDRTFLDALLQCLLDVYGPQNTSMMIDPVAELFALTFFCVLRRLGFENVYLETIDRCPLFLQQKDQAGVFAELWVLGSQCEIYFGILPRTLGEIIYDQYRRHLLQHPPPLDVWDGKEVFTAYANVVPGPNLEGDFGPPSAQVGSAGSGLPSVASADESDNRAGFAEKLAQVTSLAIFCVPAIVDICLLTFLGRGFYLTAFMSADQRLMGSYAIIASLLLTSGVTGWVGSTGGFFMFAFAFDNMTYFLVERLSGGFVLSTCVSLLGFIAFAFQYSPLAGFIFAAYLMALTTFLNLLGMMATMNREGAPLTSGRTELAKCMSVLFISPVLTTFVNNHDIIVYLIVIYFFVGLLTYKFHRLCAEWTEFSGRIPAIKEKDILDWYSKRTTSGAESTTPSFSDARSALYKEVRKANISKPWWPSLHQKQQPNEFINKLAAGYDYSMWLLKKEAGDAPLPDTYNTTWLIQLSLALANQRQLIKALKQHSPFIFFRYSKYDIAQNVGLFLVALLDHLVSIVMSARSPQPLQYFDARARYGIACGLLYLLFSAVCVDIVLQRFWASAYEVSKEPVSGMSQVEQILARNKQSHRTRYLHGLRDLSVYLLVSFGLCTILCWLLVESPKSLITYLLYVPGYTGVILFQFNRCFTNDPRRHVQVVFCAAAIGFIFGIILRAVPSTADFFYTYVLAIDVASILAVLGTSFLVLYHPKRENRPEQDCGSMQGPPIQQNSTSPTRSEASALMRHLCFGIDLATDWNDLPEDVRRAIVSRLSGRSYELTTRLKTWLEYRHINLEFYDSGTNPKAASKAMSTHVEIRQLSETDACLPTKAVAPELDFECQFPIRKPSNFTLCQEYIVRALYSTVKWIGMITTAAPDAGRELWYGLRDCSLRSPILWVSLKAWKVCSWSRSFWIEHLLFRNKAKLLPILKLARRGAARILTKDVIVVDTGRRKILGSISHGSQSRLIINIHDGLTTKPDAAARSSAVASYDNHFRLVCYETAVPQDGATPTTCVYQYAQESKNRRRWPTTKTIVAEEGTCVSNYDRHGRVVSGQLVRLGKRYSFKYQFRPRPKGNSEVLSATYLCLEAGSAFAVTVYWCVRPKDAKELRDWIPSDKITGLAVTKDGMVQNTTWSYEHKRDPVMTTRTKFADGKVAFTDPPVEAVKDDFGFHQKPRDLSFDAEDLLIYHSSRSLKRLLVPEANVFSRVSTRLPPALVRPFVRLRTLMRFDQVTVRRKVPTHVLRTILWTAWTKNSDVDAVSSCYLDELILRQEPVLNKYWRLRDAGHFRRASDYLDVALEEIVATIEPSNEASQNCSLLIKPADLFTMGLGKDANQITARPDSCYRDTFNRTSVVFSDNGCWPDSPGGVSNCRRDVVDGHSTIRNHALAEAANDYGIPRYQIERSVNSVKVLPLWGLDTKAPYHGVFDNLLQTQVEEKAINTRVDEDIVGVFIPLLRTFVRGARTKCPSKADIVSCSNVILKMHHYFSCKDYTKTWNSTEVFSAWVEAWLIPYHDPNVTDPSEYLKIEQPSLSDFREVLNLYICYFFIYAVQIPKHCPAVFQSTHHGVSSLFGMILKYRRGTAWGIWDHAILWRETCLNISPAQCLLPIPVQSMLLAGIKLACHIAYTHVDIILPCTSVFNPDWEMDLGTDQGRRGSKALFARKIDPIVNGIGNMDAFKVVEKVTSELPTTIMLSNVQFIKDVKNAVHAANVIVNKFGFTSYRLKVYGAQDRQPSYMLETETIITQYKLSANVCLAGFGKPAQVLTEAWLFMNSSLSEGLPLAIGEAALAGVPIVATEVGATALVLTDPDDKRIRYGEVVPPNDPDALARAQLSLLAMLGPWTKYCADYDVNDPATAPKLPDSFTPEDVKWITQRMYDKTADRRALGLKLRAVVLRNFHGSRYLREHEQMYWVQRFWGEYRREKKVLWGQGKREVGVTEDITFTAVDPEAIEGKWTEKEKLWRHFEDERKDSVVGRSLRSIERLLSRRASNTPQLPGGGGVDNAEAGLCGGEPSLELGDLGERPAEWARVATSVELGDMGESPAEWAWKTSTDFERLSTEMLVNMGSETVGGDY